MVDIPSPRDTTRSEESSTRRGVRARHARLFELLPEACLVTDHEGLILEANRAAHALLSPLALGPPLVGRSLTSYLRLREHLQGRPRWSLLPGPSGPRRWECLLASTPPRPVLVSLAVEGEELLWILSEGLAVGRRSLAPPAEPEPDHERDHERQARQRLEQEAAQREELVALVSHELRNAVHGVLSWSQMMQDSPRLDECHQALRVVERSGRLMAMLVDDLLERSSLLQAPRPLPRHALDLGALLEHVRLLFEPLRRGPTLRLELTRPAGPVWIAGDEHRLTQVFLNLLANALKYSSVGGLIAVDLRTDHAWAEVRVRDAGQGIAAEHLGQIFRPRYQGDGPPQSSSRGLGLGLAVVESLVTSHDGSVEAQSEGHGRGTTFVVRLPLSRSG